MVTSVFRGANMLSSVSLGTNMVSSVFLRLNIASSLCLGVLACLLTSGARAVEVDLHQVTSSEDHYSSSLCLVSGCDCLENAGTGLLDVICNCQNKQVMKVGLPSVVSDSSLPPRNTGSLVLSGCGHLEIYSGVINHMPGLENITVKDIHSLVLHPHLYQTKGPFRKAEGKISNIDITNVRRLQVKRFTFRDMEVTNRFYLAEVKMASVVSLAFTFKFVKEFSVFASVFDRISMFGIKLPNCKEFNVLGMTHFTSLAAHAIKVKCDKFSLAYNWFGRLHDSSFEIEYGLCDIQGNTFVSLGGKPFLHMRPSSSLALTGNTEIAMSGLVFRENKFSAEPTLPFGSLAMPSFSLLSPDTSYVDIESNQFPCNCPTVGWFLAYGKFGFNSHSLRQVGATSGPGTTDFVSQLYSSAGPCLEGEGDLKSYTDTALVWEEGSLTCGALGVKIRNRDEESLEKEEEADKEEAVGSVKTISETVNIEDITETKDILATPQPWKKGKDQYEGEKSSKKRTLVSRKMSMGSGEEKERILLSSAARLPCIISHQILFLLSVILLKIV